MKLSEATPATIRFASLAGVGLVVGLTVMLARGSAQQPAPTSPTVPTPAPKVRAHSTGYPTSNTKQAPGTLPAPNAVQLGEGNAEDAKGPELTLGECISIALERNPSIHAVQKRMEATEASLRGLNGIGIVGRTLSPDLPVRKEQATRGITAAAADLQKVHNDVVHDVTRLYFTVMYARQQGKFAVGVVTELKRFTEKAEEALEKGADEKMSRVKIDAMKIAVADAEIIIQQARTGEQQAMAALREAMAVCDTDFAFEVEAGELPSMEQKVPLPRETLVRLALERRPELALAAAGVDAFRLEVYAQGRLHFRRAVPTLAAGADIHAQEVPQSVRTLKEFRPGAIGPEMPTQLVGTKYDRVSRAMAFSQRAEDVYQKAHNLIVLEAETVSSDLEMSKTRLELAGRKDAHGKSMSEYAFKNFLVREKEAMFQAYVAGWKAQSDFVEAKYQYLLTLTAIERVTAGGVCPKFPGREREAK